MGTQLTKGANTGAIQSGVKRLAKKPVIDNSISSFIEETFSGFIGVESFKWYKTIDRDHIELLGGTYKGMANLERINDIRQINKFLEAANGSMTEGEYLLVCAETKNSRRKRIFNKFPAYISHPYYVLDFLLKRVFPKWRLTYKIYYAITKGRNRVLTHTETLGRLYSCGFSVINHTRIGYNTYYIVKKTGEPAYNMKPSYGVLVHLNRVGFNGKMISVSKVRTMHPYSEYIQDYVYEKNDLQDGGKIKNDFRVTSWGKWFRKLWIDELPMLMNVCKREMKVVGVRPLSRHYFDLYPQEAQQLRVTVKPGLVPPFYADLPTTFEEIVESELTYIQAYHEKPIRTDIRYFFRAMNNILIKRARSA